MQLKQKVDASVTVEASFIIPMIFFVILAIIYLCMFMYDKAKMQTDLALGLEYARERAEIGEAFHSDEVEEYLRCRMQTGYISCIVADLRVGMVAGRVTVSASLIMKTPNEGLIGALTDNFKEVTMSSETYISNREKILRMIMSGMDIWNEVK